MSFIFVYITNPSKKDAEKLALQLLKKKLIACANVFPVESFYLWKGKIEKSKEYVIIAKTIKENFEKIKEEVKKIHEYKVPLIARIEVKANKEYERWVRKEVK
ncbi:MAG: divalent cation tolerance protein CutA [Candidatus Aenigmatarchaeota archaeon]